MIVDNIRTLCKERGISLLRLETDCGFPNGTINKWDTNTPSVRKVLVVARYFSVTVEDICGDDAPEQAEQENANEQVGS